MFVCDGVCMGLGVGGGGGGLNILCNCIIHRLIYTCSKFCKSRKCPHPTPGFKSDGGGGGGEGAKKAKFLQRKDVRAKLVGDQDCVLEFFKSA